MKAILGGFVFELNSALYDEIQRNVSRRIVEQERFGQRAALHDAGPGPETQTLPGSIYPCVAGSEQDITYLEQMMNMGKSHLFIGQDGRLAGFWWIRDVQTTKREFDGQGWAKEIEFSLELVREK